LLTWLLVTWLLLTWLLMWLLTWLLTWLLLWLLLQLLELHLVQWEPMRAAWAQWEPQVLLLVLPPLAWLLERPTQ
jgi:hypothetical protein